MQGLSVLLQVVSLGFLLPYALVLHITESRSAKLAQTVVTSCSLIGLWIGGGNRSLGYLTLNLTLTLLICIYTFTYWYLYRYAALSNTLSTQYVKSAYHGASVSLLVLGWFQITCGTLDNLGILHHNLIMIAHSCPALLIIGLATFWLTSSAGIGRHGYCRSPEYYDCLYTTGMSVVLIPVVIGTDIMGRDLEAPLGFPPHLFYLLVMLAASQLGIWLSRDRYNAPRRNLMLALICVLWGQQMAAHHQDSKLAKSVHESFGHTLLAMGAARALEILVIPSISPAHSTSSEHEHLRYLPPMFGFVAAFMILGGSHDMIRTFEELGSDSSGYIALLQACGFGLFLFIAVLIRRVAASLELDDGDKTYDYEECTTEGSERQPLAP
ncbi:hypothetical protein BDV27DRAFT_156641 [Aspergillus caelatus]|uniref:Protein YTP1-like C-terminal domain-containing protein n=1 Tax=Aspergillus caelatus TaxID=61420 RepID=A0A5N7A9G0_9EURO|nr:uncharacterized protein BDV27DRAFT_156641 [Aspergillus caelatus]KAE8365759.1 hypothetical protein BDV27DRAFT_156641 [Aspergillus caelatus]